MEQSSSLKKTGNIKALINSHCFTLLLLPLVLVVSAAPIMIASDNNFFSYAYSFSSDPELSDPSSQINILISRSANTTTNLEATDSGGVDDGCPEVKVFSSNQSSVDSNNNNLQTLTQLLQRNKTIDTANECGYTLESSNLAAFGIGRDILQDRRH